MKIQEQVSFDFWGGQFLSLKSNFVTFWAWGKERISFLLSFISFSLYDDICANLENVFLKDDIYYFVNVSRQFWSNAHNWPF